VGLDGGQRQEDVLGVTINEVGDLIALD